MPNDTRRKFIKATALGSVAALAGCLGGGGNGNGGDGSGNLKFVHLGTFDGEASEFLPRFQEQYPETSVEHQQTPAQSASSREYYINQFVGQANDFDVGQMDVIWPAEFVENGWITEIEDPENHTDAMLETPVEAATIDGTLYGMPLYTDANALYYRSDKLEEYGYEPPETYMELVNTAQDVMQQDDEIDNGYIWQGGANEGLTIMWLNWLWGMDGTVEQDGGLQVNTDKGVQALQHAVDLIHEYGVTPGNVPSSNTDQNRQTFQNGNTLFMRNWPYAVNVMNEDGSPVQGSFDVTPLPTHEDYPDVDNSCLGGWNIFINEYSENKEAAQRFASYMASEEVQRELATEFSRLPVHQGVFEDESIREEFPLLGTFSESLQSTRVRPGIAQYPTFSEIVYTQANTALVQEKTPQQALDDAQSEIDSEINNG
ncbi:trehalose/maltose-binding protein MalE [Halalkalicoccus paucihalophilus]|uniref:Trehalose/maltose-binding protein MalE n=1 Tax=Halalkalicoccus paucihalophilus TaxID=1008153 RepID=A0A151AAM4_9EURY|nr:ABC transporter substrate-binding protein [Halalkalicoccus paucihalophilus]KYH24417.1 trehalose/maltose-binding protein MalE [Halalkalicoccus paucihalophilus]